MGRSGVRGLLLLGGKAGAVPATGSDPAEDGDTRTLAPAPLGAAAAQPGPADPQCVGSATANG
jgi:hypothetical protein